MQKYFAILIIASFIVSCKPKTEDNSLTGKKATLVEKISQLKSLESEIKQLESDIAILDPQKEKESLAITTLQMENREFKRFIELQAIVATDDIVNASSDMGGRILKQMVKEGQLVKKGQLIATTDGENIDKQREEIQKSLDLATDVYDRQKRLWDQNIGSEVQFLQAKNNKERLEKSLQTLGVQSKKRNVYAPISGAVDKVFLKEGELAAPGAPIVQILNTSKVKVVTDVPETYLGKVKTGDKVNIHFPALNKEVVKNVSLIGRTIDPSNRTFKMEISIDNPLGELKPNLLSLVKVNDLTIKNAIYLPVDNIQAEVSGKKYLFVVNNDNGKAVAKKAYVTTGESSNNNIVITEGLKVGDQVIIKGARSVTEGQGVIVETK